MSVVVEVVSVSVAQRLQEVSLALPGAGVSCVLGQNGAGKTTLLECVAGLLAPDKGTIYWQSVDLESVPLTEQAAVRCYQTQGDSMQFELTAREFLSFYTQGAGSDLIPDELETVLEVAVLLDKPFVRLSGGEQQRVTLARTLLQNWAGVLAGKCLIVLDEPLKGLDIRHQRIFLQFLRTLAGYGNQVMFSCHDINAALSCADFACLLKQGKLLAAGPCMEVVTTESLQQVFDCEFEFVPALNCGIYLQKP
ncbi:ABC transporter ATP-binding protein [Alteromonas gilva]|uniref:ABC transporter ATP-binding protein n=1 Tax=Alteromonas gilva TaxID=2987522 RepID=A0ABT5L4I7_9ALTE|nr:ABC transporter ATP-binding protein [Alteromonas gilva]MDC8831767.1 ABC transporter ATP-binding protein [Alteromonas gilva]